MTGREFPYVAYGGRTSGRRPSCACLEPREARLVAERATLLAEPTLAERGRVHRARGTEPIVLAGSGESKCRPFLKVEKDPVKFAACNSLADEVGPLNTPKKAFRILEEAIGDEVNEVFCVVTLDLHLRMKSIAETGRGEPSAVAAPMVPTLQAALIDGAHGVIIAHVHPSGIEAKPSQADKDTTKAFVKAFETVNVYFIDHIIVGGSVTDRSYFSFAEEGML